MNTRIKRRAERGFTLIELLATISIVAVLAGLALSALSPVKRSRQQAQCANNLKQIGVGLFSYAMEHDNCLPAIYTTYPVTGQEQMWGYEVWPYIYGSYKTFKYPDNDTQMSLKATRPLKMNAFRCPATREQQIKAPTLSGEPSGSRMSYGLNNTPLGSSWWTFRTTPIPLSRVTKPSVAAMVIDSSYGDANWDTYPHYFGLIPHKNGANVLFYDGHVEWRAFTSIPSTYTAYSDPFWSGN